MYTLILVFAPTNRPPITRKLMPAYICPHSHISPHMSTSVASSANTILNVARTPSEPALMKLLFAICVPHLSYASDVLTYSARQMQPMTVALNDCVRRIFGYHRWESVRFLRSSFGYPSVVEIFASRSRRFYSKLPHIGNSTLKGLAEANLN